MSNDVNFGTKQWYVVNTYSGRERAVADMLEKRKYTQNLENYIFRIVVAETVLSSISERFRTERWS